MRTRGREFLACLLVASITFSPLTYYGQEKPPEEKGRAGQSSESARDLREIQEYGHILSPEERQKEEQKKIDEALKCPGCTSEQRKDGEIVAGSIKAARINAAEKTEINNELRPSIDTFLVAPANSEEYVRIFGTPGTTSQDTTMAQLREIRRIRQQMKADFGGTARSPDLNSTNVRRAIRFSRSSFILIVGHNDQGSFRFLDGSSVQLDDFVDATRPDQRMIIVSCSAKAMLSNQAAHKAAATQDDLTYPQAFEIAKAIQEYLASAGPQVSLEMVRQALQRAESKSAFNYRMGIFVRQVAVLGGVTMVIALVISGGIPCLRKDECR
jgi:hypothetical protein